MLPAFQRYWHADQVEPQFLLEFYSPSDAPRLRLAFAGAVLYQVLVVLLAILAVVIASEALSAHVRARIS